MSLPTDVSLLGLTEQPEEEEVVEYPEAVAVTKGSRHHFFGYYDKCPWDPTGRYMLALEATFVDRQPRVRDSALVGVIDTEEDNEFRPIGKTRAWNWQQGCMLQWLPGSEDEIIYNDRRRRKFISVIQNIHTKKERTLPLPIYCVSHDGKHALGLNFARLHRLRPGYGYIGVDDLFEKENAPSRDGIYKMDLETGEHELLINLGLIWERQHRASMEGRQHWLNHLQFNPDDSRFCFIHRWRRDSRSWWSRLFTAQADGDDLYLLINDDMVSHFDWLDEGNLFAWARMPGTGDRFYTFIDHSDKKQSIDPDQLPVDGHCSFSPDRRWILTDSYPDAEGIRVLMLYNREEDETQIIGEFYSPPAISGPLRCDLHPRWNRDGTKICIDSLHEKTRQMYVIDVTDIVTPPEPEPEEEEEE